MPTIYIVTLSVASLACAVDLRTRRIPNWLTIGSAAAAVVFHGATGGAGAVVVSGLGWGASAALLIAPYALGGLGAGDVKLVAALGAWLGPGDSFSLTMYTCIAGAVMAVVVAVWHGYLRQALRNLWLLLTYWRVSGLRPVPELTLSTSKGPRLAYAAPILVGTIVTLWLR
jgi:prepilin peptidase CpaA